MQKFKEVEVEFKMLVHKDAINLTQRLQRFDQIGVIDPLNPDVLRTIEDIKSMKFSEDHPSVVRKLMADRRVIKIEEVKK